jgi:hypothetical protein
MDAQKRFWKIPLLALLAGCALILSACGDDVSVGSSGASGTAGAPATSTVASVAISGNPATTATAGTAYSFQPSVTQTGGAVTYSITGKPNWASFNSSTGALTGTPSTSDEGTSGSITISASNGSNSASLNPFTIKVNAPSSSTTSGSAILSWLAPTTNADGSALTDLAGFHIYFGTNQNSLNQTVDVNSPTETSYVINGLAQGTYYFSIVAYNSAGVDSNDSNMVSKTI